MTDSQFDAIIGYGERVLLTTTLLLGDSTVFATLFATIDCFFRNTLGTIPSLSLQRVPEDSKVYKRSNYTRIEHNNYSWGFIPTVTGEEMVIRTHPNKTGLARVFTAQREMIVDSQELRSLAYTFLAAANSIDGRDNKTRRKATRKRIPEVIR